MHATQAIAFEWKPGFRSLIFLISLLDFNDLWLIFEEQYRA